MTSFVAVGDVFAQGHCEEAGARVREQGQSATLVKTIGIVIPTASGDAESVSFLIFVQGFRASYGRTL
jgi:hypothetical protein